MKTIIAMLLALVLLVPAPAAAQCPTQLDVIGKLQDVFNAYSGTGPHFVCRDSKRNCWLYTLIQEPGDTQEVFYDSPAANGDCSITGCDSNGPAYCVSPLEWVARIAEVLQNVDGRCEYFDNERGWRGWRIFYTLNGEERKLLWQQQLPGGPQIGGCNDEF